MKDHFENRLLNFIDRTLTTRITPMAYLFVIYDFFYALGLSFPTGAKGSGATVLARIEPLFPSEIWGLLLLLATVLIFAGALTKVKEPIRVGGTIGFCLWVSAAIAYALSGYLWIHAPMAVLQTLIFGYYVLAASLDRLWDYSPADDW